MWPQEGLQVAARGDATVSSIVSRLIAKGGSLLANDALRRLKLLEPVAAKIEELEASGVALRRHSRKRMEIIRPRLSQAEKMLDYVLERESQIPYLPERRNPFFEPSWVGRKLQTLSSIFHPSRVEAPEIKNLNKKRLEVEDLIEKAWKDFQLDLPTSSIDKVIVRDAECGKIVAALYGTQQQDDDDDDDGRRPYAVMGIHGAAGSGKTTLAQRAYDRAKEDKDEDGGSRFFELFIWVQVRRHSTPHGVLDDMMKQAVMQRHDDDQVFDRDSDTDIVSLESKSHQDTGRPPSYPLFDSDTDTDTDDMKKEATAGRYPLFDRDGHGDSDIVSLLRRSLEDELRGKRILLVLDDVRCDGNDELKEILSPLDVVASGSKVLLTARSVDALRDLGTTKSGCIPIRELDDDVFLRLFMHCALGDDGVVEEHPDRDILQVIGAKIAAKLNKSPLAARLVGMELRATPTIESWRKFRDTICNA